MGLIISVYRSTRGDCSNGGVSVHDDLTVVNLPGPFDPTPNRPAVILERGPGGDLRLFEATEDLTTGRWVRARRAGQAGPMFGGNYAGSSDGRWPAPGPLAVQDRWESAALYEALST